MRSAGFSYGIRIVAGAYLEYLAYQLISGFVNGDETGIQFLLAGIIFAIIGAICVISGGRYFFTGKMDKNDKRGETSGKDEEDTPK